MQEREIRPRGPFALWVSVDALEEQLRWHLYVIYILRTELVHSEDANPLQNVLLRICVCKCASVQHQAIELMQEQLVRSVLQDSPNSVKVDQSLRDTVTF